MPDNDAPPTDAQDAPDPTTEPQTAFDSLPSGWQAEIKRLRGEAAEHRRRIKDLEPEVDRLREAQMTEQQRIETRASQAEERASRAERQVAQYAAAAKAGLPLDLAARLQGNTAEELDADAEQLKNLLGGNGQQRFEGRVNGGARAPVPANDMNSLIRQAAGIS